MSVMLFKTLGSLTTILLIIDLITIGITTSTLLSLDKEAKEKWAVFIDGIYILLLLLFLGVINSSVKFMLIVND